MSATTVYLPVEEQPHLEIMVETWMLDMMIISGGYRLWVTDTVRPARPEDAPPDAEVYWYWAQTPQHANGHPICTAEVVLSALYEQHRMSYADLATLAHAYPKRDLVVRIPRIVAPRETAVFMRWIDPTLAGKEVKE